MIVLGLIFLLISNGTDGRPLFKESFTYGILQGYFNTEDKSNLIELDILKTPVDKNERRKRAVLLMPERKWINGVVPYVFDEISPLSDNAKKTVNDSIKHIEQLTCVRFVKRTIQPNYINITKGSGCSSYVGNVNQGSQNVNIGPSCEQVATVVHELLHALGFLHEHTRLDRDDFVFINLTNVQTGYENQFDKYNEVDIGPVSTQGIPYDFSSVMHYANYVFSKYVDPITNLLGKEGKMYMTIYSKQDPLRKLGSLTGLSQADIMRVNEFYNCSEITTTAPLSTVSTSVPRQEASSQSVISTPLSNFTTTQKTTKINLANTTRVLNSENNSTNTTRDPNSSLSVSPTVNILLLGSIWFFVDFIF